jgi:hypothetical protein
MTVDFTQVVLAIVGALFTGATGLFSLWLQSHIKDQAAAATIGTAVKNSLGAAQNAIDAGLQYHPLQASLPTGTSPAVAAGVKYILDQAGPELTRLGTISNEALAAKVAAQMGLAKVPATPTTAVTP